jgi:hypothetical protein
MNGYIYKLLFLLRTLARWITAIGFVFFSILAIVSWSLVNLISTPTNYSLVLNQSQFAKRSRAPLADFLVSYSATLDMNTAFLKDYPLQVWEDVAGVILPENWIATNADQLSKDFVNWLTDDKVLLPEFTIDLNEPLQELRGPSGALAILPLLENVPECSPDTHTITLMKNGELVSCLPLQNNLTDIAQTNAQIIASVLPTSISTASLDQAGIITPELFIDLTRVRLIYKALTDFTVLSVRLSLLFLGLYLLLNISGGKLSWRRLPWIFLVTSLLTILAGGFLWVMVSWPNSPLISGFTIGFQSEISAFLQDLVRSTAKLLVKDWIYAAMAFLGISILFFILFALIDRIKNLLNPTETIVPEEKIRIRKEFR